MGSYTGLIERYFNAFSYAGLEKAACYINKNKLETINLLANRLIKKANDIRLFKYLLRVAAFYNAKADAIEFKTINPEQDLAKLMELFTPDKYDISDLQQSSISDNLVEIIKSKLLK